MRVFALVGKSGTGKSFQCTELAREHNIEAIIDDGLLISGNRILAGKSAKHEKTKMASVKSAIFANDNHAQSIKISIRDHDLKSVLILGTSDRMIFEIASRLELPAPERIFQIEELATPDEINTAKTMREKHGKHIIPAPVLEVKKQFSGYFLNSLILPEKRDLSLEKTVMRPTYSYLGSFKISPKVIAEICRYELSQIPEVVDVFKIQSYSDINGYIDISVEVSLRYPCNVPDISALIQSTLGMAVEHSTSIIAKNINIFIKSLVSKS
ncbi:MAG: Asp23/Gls24 family envelope stress response protein [Clostridia bacterium]|nr:Asp23/Gls24 family envelope stress response protein [Clostridia bacterium]